MPCALEACRADGVAYALPQLLCTDLLYTREGDSELAAAGTVGEMYRVIGDTRADGLAGPDDCLLVSIPDPLSEALWYLDIQIDLEQNFSEWVAIPEAGAYDADIMAVLELLQEMAGGGRTDALPPDDVSYEEWFAEGRGRAFIGFSESMCAMGDYAGSVAFHRFSLSEEADIPMMYADIASVNAGIAADKRDLAVELLNVVTGREVLAAADQAA